MPISRPGGLKRGPLFDTNIPATEIDKDIFTDQEVETSIAGDDLILLLDVSETPDVVKYMTRTDFVDGLVGDNITVTDNEATDENNLVTFVANAAATTGSQELEMDGHFHYNPSSGLVTATTFAGALTGNADTATALATGRTIAMTGDVAWTSASFTGSGNVTGTGTIQAAAVHSTMLNNDIISGQTEITAGLAAEDELLYSDDGTIKRVGLDTLVSKLAGTGLSASSGVLAVSSAYEGDVQAVDAGVGISGGGTSGTVAVALDLSELTDTAIAHGDYIVFTDSTDSNASVKGDLADVATLFAGTGLTASNSVIGVDASQTQINAVGTIGTGTWQGTAIASSYIAADAITGAKIADDAIGSEHIADDAVVTAAIADDAITSALIADDAVVTAAIADDAITSALLADDAVVTAAIADDAITSALIADDAVVTAAIADDAITSALIADDAITSALIADDAVVAAAIADNAITLATHTTGDYVQNITGGVGIDSTGATSGENIAHSLSLDLSELTDTAIANGDYIVFTDTTDSNATVKGDLADVATLFAGTGLTASSSVIGVDASQTQITAVGTIATGTWEATDVAVAHGGTGASTLTANGVLIGNGTSAVTAVDMSTKGGLLAGDGSGNPSVLAVSATGGHVLTVDSSEATGLKWAAVEAGAATSLAATSSSANQPIVSIENTHADATAGFLKFIKNPGSGQGADADMLGTITWYGTDASNNAAEELARIESYIIEADHGSEAAGMKFYVAENDATMTAGLQILGQASDDGEIDVTIGAGAASTTTIAGTLTMGSTAALTNAGLVAVANQSNITGLGTISSGVWEGTTVAVAQGGTGATTLNNLITLGTHTAGNYVAAITAGTGLTSSGATSGETISHSLSVDASQTQITAVGTIATGVWEGTDVGVAHGGTGVSTLLTNAVLTGNGASAIQAESTLLFSSNKLIPTAAAHDAAGTTLTMSAGATTAGTSNNQAGGALTFQGGQGKGSGAGGAIIFQVANEGGSGSSLNSLATALTINDDSTITTAGAIELGHASDTTLARSGSGDLTIEGNAIYRAGGTDVAIADGGTGAGTATAGFDALSPMTTQGDILYGGSSGTVTRLAAGSDNQTLMMNGTSPNWETVTEGASVGLSVAMAIAL